MASKPQAENMCGLTASTQPGVRLARKHHLLVRASHWLNVLLLAGLIVSGISIYWASPIYQHGPDLQTGNSDYNPLQRLAYFSIPIAGFLAVVTGWAIHKPMQFAWVSALFGGFDRARVWHFWLMCLFITFVVPHVILVFADGWDTVRSMITGWSTRWGMGDQSHES